MKGIGLMARTPVHVMTREELFAEVEILRAALDRADGVTFSGDVPDVLNPLHGHFAVTWA